jgi:hypothetical protein
VEEITIKKAKKVVDLLTVADVCIEASEAWARLLESRNKGSLTKKQQDDREVNTADRGDRGNYGNHEKHQQQLAEQKEKMSFHHPNDAEKWCEIHHTAGHDLEECETFLDHKKDASTSSGAGGASRRTSSGGYRQWRSDGWDQCDIQGQPIHRLEDIRKKSLKEISVWLSASSHIEEWSGPRLTSHSS